VRPIQIHSARTCSSAGKHSGAGREKGGIGLGLAIRHAIVQQHGGRIWAESPGLGRGSTVHVVLPVLHGTCTD